MVLVLSPHKYTVGVWMVAFCNVLHHSILIVAVCFYKLLHDSFILFYTCVWRQINDLLLLLLLYVCFSSRQLPDEVAPLCDASALACFTKIDSR